MLRQKDQHEKPPIKNIFMVFIFTAILILTKRLLNHPILVQNKKNAIKRIFLAIICNHSNNGSQINSK